MGIGQANFADYRLKMVDFLPPMYMYEYIMVSKRPRPIASYDSIIYPFDAYIWIFISISMMVQFLTLFTIHKVWTFASGAKKTKKITYMKVLYILQNWHPTFWSRMILFQTYFFPLP